MPRAMGGFGVDVVVLAEVTVKNDIPNITPGKLSVGNDIPKACS